MRVSDCLGDEFQIGFRWLELKDFSRWELGRIKYLANGVNEIELSYEGFTNHPWFGWLYFDNTAVPVDFNRVRLDFKESEITFTAAVLEESQMKRARLVFKVIPEETDD